MSWPTIPLSRLLEASDSGVWGDEAPETGISVLRSTNMSNDGTLDYSNFTLRDIPEGKRAAKALRPGDIVLENSGGGPKQPVGRVCYFSGHDIEHVVGNFCRRLRAKGDVALPRFLFWRLYYGHQIGETLRYQTQTTGLRNLQFRVYVEQSIDLPALSEQTRIIEILDEADRLRRLRRRADGKVSKILPSLFLKIFGQPDTWRHTEPLGRLVTMKSGGTPSKAVPEYWHGPIPWVSPKDMKRDEIDDAEDHISETAVQESSAQLVPVGSVLIVVRGMILARDVPIAITGKTVTINQDMKALSLTDERLDPRFLFAALKVQQSRLLSEVTTAAHGTKKLESSRLESLLIPIPSPSALKKFLSAYEQLQAIDRERTATGPRVEDLFSLLLQRAFSGQLTAKWREAHMKDLLAEMARQAEALKLSPEPLATL